MNEVRWKMRVQALEVALTIVYTTLNEHSGQHPGFVPLVARLRRLLESSGDNCSACGNVSHDVAC